MPHYTEGDSRRNAKKIAHGVRVEQMHSGCKRSRMMVFTRILSTNAAVNLVRTGKQRASADNFTNQTEKN